MNETCRHSSALLTNEIGLHARPSVKLTKLAKTFESKIEVAASPDGPWVDAKSIVKVMAFKAAKGVVLHFRASGPDAEQALTRAARACRRGVSRGAGRRRNERGRARWLSCASRGGRPLGASPPARSRRSPKAPARAAGRRRARRGGTATARGARGGVAPVGGVAGTRRRRWRGYPRLPGRDARRPRAQRSRLSPRSSKGPRRRPRGKRRSAPRSPNMKARMTFISEPGRATSPTSATACSTPCAARPTRRASPRGRSCWRATFRPPGFSRPTGAAAAGSPS